MGNLLNITDLKIKLGTTVLLTIPSFCIQAGEQWAIIGGSGSGKTSLALALGGRLFHSGSIKRAVGLKWVLVEQQHRFRNLSHTTNFYYQQRYQSQDADDAPVVNTLLEEHWRKDDALTRYWLEYFGLEPVLQEPLIQLSNGENKRLQLLLAVLQQPDLLILDNPFIGLDVSGREKLEAALNLLAARGVQLLLICSPGELPRAINQVALLEAGTLRSRMPREAYLVADSLTAGAQALPETVWRGITPQAATFENAVKLVNLSVRYGNRLILDRINWTVKRGECWSVSGPNGSGKSTLLSLITADNPQAYANEIYLFDKRRGHGESIWDIKNKIGLVSPELQLHFPRQLTVLEAIGSGLFDTIGLFRRLDSGQEALIKDWAAMLGLGDQLNRPMQQLSGGNQRLVILGRALVKNPLMLVLDEPCQGLDGEQVIRFNGLVEQLCRRMGTTLIYVSHYVDQVPAIISHRLVIDRGHLVQAE